VYHDIEGESVGTGGGGGGAGATGSGTATTSGGSGSDGIVVIRYEGVNRNPTYSGTMATTDADGYITHYLIDSGTFVA